MLYFDAEKLGIFKGIFIFLLDKLNNLKLLLTLILIYTFLNKVSHLYFKFIFLIKTIESSLIERKNENFLKKIYKIIILELL